MNANSIRTVVDRSTTRKVLGSVAIVGTAAAVAGLGTFGTFTDSTTPIDTTVATGTVDINAATAGFAMPTPASGFVPGDSFSRAVNLTNAGSLALGGVSLSTTLTTPQNKLTTDSLNGLQLSVDACSVPWTQAGTAQAATYTCSGTTKSYGAGSAITTMQLAGAASLNPGGTDYLVVKVSLPSTADNSFQGLNAGLQLQFNAIQRNGTVR